MNSVQVPKIESEGLGLGIQFGVTTSYSYCPSFTVPDIHDKIVYEQKMAEKHPREQRWCVILGLG